MPTREPKARRHTAAAWSSFIVSFSRSCASAACARSRRSGPTSIHTFHEAIAHEPAEGRRDGEVIEEFGRGYMLGDRMIRPAIVKVAKGE